jgi:hypothetical protein
MQDVTGLLATMIVLIALSGLFPIALVVFEAAQKGITCRITRQ